MGVTGWDLLSTLQQQSQYADYYQKQAPTACPYDGTPLKQGPPQEPGTLYCPNGDFSYPEDWDPQTMSGM